jgi:hypothetical protein
MSTTIKKFLIVEKATPASYVIGRRPEGEEISDCRCIVTSTSRER